MQPLSLDDLLPLGEYSGKRREYLESQRRYLDRYRRVRVGPSATFLFENRQTLWFRVQEFLRVARLGEPLLIQRELDLFNCLLPGPDQLQAALLVQLADQSQLIAWEELSDKHIRLSCGNQIGAAHIVTCRPEDRCIGSAHWVQFTVDKACRKQLADFRQSAMIEFSLPQYAHQSPILSDEIRQSLIDDLKLSDKAIQAAA